MNTLLHAAKVLIGLVDTPGGRIMVGIYIITLWAKFKSWHLLEDKELLMMAAGYIFGSFRGQNGKGSGATIASDDAVPNNDANSNGKP